MEEFPVLKTDRLVLRGLTVDDVPNLVRYANNRTIAANIVNISYPYSEFNATMRLGYVRKGFIEKSRFCFAIALKTGEGCIGEISLHLTDPVNRVAELGYWIGEPFWNQGYTTEAIAAVLDYGLNTANFTVIYATCKTGNVASMRVLVKNNMVKFREDAHQLAYKIEQ